MRLAARAVSAVLACLFLWVGNAEAQPANKPCATQQSLVGTQSLSCENGITIVAESGARFELRDDNRDGRVDSVELSSKALMVEVTKKQGGHRFKVVTPQAVAAVRGTKWAVDVAEAKTSVFVVDGRVSVARRAGRDRVVLGQGEGVDVEGSGALIVKHWPAARVAALLARLRQ
jgi:ferric-dicitrate binding protein FerR (iron transport regulator)